MPNLNTRKTSALIGIVTVIAIVVVVILRTRDSEKQNKADQATNQTAISQAPPAESISSSSPEDSSSSKANPQVSPKLGYTEALKKFGTNRIQFDTNCQAHPSNVTFKNGTQVMLDNRSSAARTISLLNQKHVIAAQDYTVVTMSTNQASTTTLVDCDKYQNVATILIQK